RMTTTTIAAPAPSAPRSRIFGRLGLVIASIALALAGISTGTWLAVDLTAGSATAAAATPVFRTWMKPIDVVSLQQQRVRAGYSIAVDPIAADDGILDPVTRSALADFLQPSSRHRLRAPLAAALQGTVITALRDPVTWNRRFGLNRRTRSVERPVTGPAG